LCFASLLLDFTNTTSPLYIDFTPLESSSKVFSTVYFQSC